MNSLFVKGLSVLGMLLLMLAAPVNAAETLLPVEVKISDDLDEDGKLAKEKQVPILLMFSMKHCGYCSLVEEDFLKPMLRNEEYDNKVLIRKVILDGSKGLMDFTGKFRDPDELSDDYQVSMVPTVIMVDSKGRPLSKKIIGMANKYYYGGELDEAIESSLQQLRSVALK